MYRFSFKNRFKVIKVYVGILKYNLCIYFLKKIYHISNEYNINQVRLNNIHTDYIMFLEL